MSVWKTREEAYHGSKWGYAVVALVIFIFLSILCSIFYLAGQGIRSMNLSPTDALLVAAAAIGAAAVLLLLAWFVAAVHSFIMNVLKVVWTMFSNFYVLVIGVILAIVLFSALAGSVIYNLDVTLTSPLVIALLLALLILFFPLAIFIIDLFSLEQE